MENLPKTAQWTPEEKQRKASVKKAWKTMTEQSNNSVPFYKRTVKIHYKPVE